MFNRLSYAATILLFLSGSCFADHTGAHLIYDVDTGSLTFESNAENITTLELKSTTGDLFVGDRPANHNGLFDVYTSTKSFKLDPAGFSTADMGNIGVDSLEAFWALEIAGAKVGGGGIQTVGDGVFLIPPPIPEPSSFFLLILGSLGIFRLARR